MYNSFIVLFEHGLNPGGVYFLEDLLCSRGMDFIDGDKQARGMYIVIRFSFNPISPLPSLPLPQLGSSQHVMIDVIKEWIETLTMVPRVPSNNYTAR